MAKDNTNEVEELEDVETDEETDEVEEKVKTITPGQLALELDQDPKQIRAYLRANHPRKPDQKNTSWALTEELANDVRDYFSEKDEDEVLEELESDEV